MDNKKISKILTIVAAVIGVVALIFLIRIIMAGEDAIKSSADLQSSIIDPFITFTKIVLFIAAAATVIFSIINLVKNPKALKKSLLMIAVLVVLLLIAYLPASDAVVTNVTGNVIEESKNPSVSKWVSGLISFTGYLGLVGLVVIVWGIVKGALK